MQATRSEEQAFQDLLKQVYPDHKIEFGATEGSSLENETLRSTARKKIVEALKNLNEPLTLDDEARLLDLKQVPELAHASISISHTASTACWVISPQTLKLGLDLENPERVSIPILKRVCSQQEINKAPSHAALWCAKEAAFKALNRTEGTSVLSQIEASQWFPLGTTAWIFTVKVNEKKISQGLSTVFKALQIAIFVDSTQFL